MRLLSSLLPTKRFPLETRSAENVFMRGRSSRSNEPRSGTWAAAHAVRRMNQHGFIEPALYRRADVRSKAEVSLWHHGFLGDGLTIANGCALEIPRKGVEVSSTPLCGLATLRDHLLPVPSRFA